MSEIILSDHVEPCGEVGDLRNVYAIGTYDSEATYLIDVETITGGAAGADGAGSMRLPVQSIGKRDRQFFFSTDFRFVNSVGIECVFPLERTLRSEVDTGAGKRVFSLWFRDIPIFTSKARPTIAAALEEAALWARRAGPIWDYPEEVVEEMSKANNDEASADTESEEVGETAMDAAFG